MVLTVGKNLIFTLLFYSLISRLLVKDVHARATLKEITENPWVKAGDLGLAQILPLVGRDLLPHNAHTTIIDQMVAGGVDTKENILRQANILFIHKHLFKSLEKDDFSYVTATYYLLAERVLASYREERAKKALAIERPKLDELPDALQNCSDIRTTYTKGDDNNGCKGRSRSNSWRGSTSISRRPCSILKEESEEELSTYHRNSSRQSSRYSSSSLSVFASISGSRGRMSSHDIQSLLEVSPSNLIDSKKRTLSPDSRLSSRSSSPPNSSGRTSPDFLPKCKYLAVSRLKASVLGPCGLRKLGSSPHLLGICEEKEEFEFDRGGEQRQTAARRSISGASITLSTIPRIFPQPKHMKEDYVAGSVTYSKVRMIRPRQAKVSPDMAQRYEKESLSRFPTTKARRSTSCSSGETSDDDSEKRLNFLASKYCHSNGRRREDDDDSSKGSFPNSSCDGGKWIGPTSARIDQVASSAVNSCDTAPCNPNYHKSGQMKRIELLPNGWICGSIIWFKPWGGSGIKIWLQHSLDIRELY
ncbi:unnamed protein product [Thelazia callipaeda]|uniref:RICTOR_V domain-containing protein n=1 Tax=Thelazia callipaeda TaxID=103827 RepID=A0A0N5D130_THECL|nr:unnamed protein product [Thelazia callipaeda]